MTTNPKKKTPDAGDDDDEKVEDVLVTAVKALIPPAILQEELPISVAVKRHVRSGRQQSTDIINGIDDRLLVIVGPCSIHDYQAALDYGILSCEITLLSIYRSSLESAGG